MGRGVVGLLLNREHILLNRFLIAPQLVQRVTKLVVRFGIVGLDLNRFAQLISRFRVTFEIVQTPTEIVLSGRVAGTQLESALVRLRGLGLVLSVVVIDIAETQMREAHV